MRSNPRPCRKSHSVVHLQTLYRTRLFEEQHYSYISNVQSIY